MYFLHTYFGPGTALCIYYLFFFFLISLVILSFLIFIYLFIFGYTWASSSCGKPGLLSVAAGGLLIVVASLAAEHGFQGNGLQ